MVEQTQLLVEALKQFGLWSNYMLVTTVAALAWVAKSDRVALSKATLIMTVVCLSASIVFAVLTLALVPVVAENLGNAKSIYAVRATVKVLWLWGPESSVPLKLVCWPQHAFFLLGIIFFAGGSIGHTRRQHKVAQQSAAGDVRNARA